MSQSSSYIFAYTLRIRTINMKFRKLFIRFTIAAKSSFGGEKCNYFHFSIYDIC